MIPPAAASSSAPATPRRGGAITEEERQSKRKTSNRLSAQRSRVKRQQREDHLVARATQLERHNEAMRAAIGHLLQLCSVVEQRNRVLSADARYLHSLLQERNSQLNILGEIACVPMDVPETPAYLTQLYGGLLTPLPPAPAPPLSLPPEIPMPFLPDYPDDIMEEDELPEEEHPYPE